MRIQSWTDPSGVPSKCAQPSIWGTAILKAEREVLGKVHREDLMVQEGWLVKAEQDPTARAMSKLGRKWAWWRRGRQVHSYSSPDVRWRPDHQV